MLNYDEFPYQEYFFDSISNIQSLYEEIQKNTNLEDEEISNIWSYNGYLEVKFFSDLKYSYDNKVKNTESFFHFLFLKIDQTNQFYTELLSNSNTDKKYIPLLKILIKENCAKINKIIADYTVLVNYITVHENKIREIINRYSNDFSWKEIFLNASDYLKFKNYTKNYIIDKYVDYSYLFQRMLFKNIIYKNTKHHDFMIWLKENSFINENTYNDFYEKNSFRSLKKSYSVNRENNFNIVFEI